MRMFMKIIWVISALLLVGCGGGGSSTAIESSLEYTGNSEKAVLTEESTKSFLDLTGAGLSVLQYTSPYYKSQKITAAKPNYKLANQTVPNFKVIDSETIEGEISGEVTIVAEETGTYTGTLTYTYSNYSDMEGLIFDGKVINYITIDKEGIITKIVKKYQLLNMKVEKDDVTFDGTITNTANKIVENLVAKNNKTGEMIKYDNYEVSLNEDGRVISYKGKIYDSNYGYVDVSTLTPLVYNADGSRKAEGEVLLDGETSSVTVKYAYDNRVRVEIDSDKDGTVDSVQVYAQGDYENELPNAAPVISITFPQSIYTDTDMSQVQVNVYDPDLDGFTTSYEWRANDTVKASALALDNALFVKHDVLKLIVTATDDRVGDEKSSTISKEQEVLNSRPVASIESNATTEDIEALATVAFDASGSMDADEDPLTYEWKVYRYIHETEWSGEPIVGDTALENGYMLIEVDSNKYFDDTKKEKPIFSAVVEGKHIIRCTVFDDELAEDFTEMNLTIKPLDIIESTESKVFFTDQETLGEFTFNNPITTYDLNNDGQNELIYFTRDPQDTSKTLLHITYDAKRDSTTSSYDVNSTALSIKDVNSDGLVDLIIGQYRDQATMLQNTRGTFEEPFKYYIWYELILVDDVNEDNRFDGARLNKCTLEFYTNFDNYDEKTQYAVQDCNKTDANGMEYEHLLKVNDFNNDGIQDYLIYNHNLYNGSVELIIVYKDETGEFVQGTVTALGSWSYSDMVTVGDVNGDGYNDIVIGFTLLENNKDMTFKKIQDLKTLNNGSTNDNVIIADINNDGKEDILYKNGETLRVLVQGDNYQMNDFELKNVIDNMVVSDIDNDGKAEIMENYQNRILITRECKINCVNPPSIS